MGERIWQEQTATNLLTVMILLIWMIRTDDLKIEVVAGDKPMVCDHQLGESFYLQGEMLIFPPEGRQRFPLYPLAALLPLLPAKQRQTHPHDWMTTDADIACPDPHCGRYSALPGNRSAASAMPKPPGCHCLARRVRFEQLAAD